MSPVASVIIPVRNGAPTLAEQLEALERTSDPGCPFEIVVVDNGSTDRTVDVANSFIDRIPLRVVDASDADGPGAVRNVGVRHAGGTWLLFCDADDVVDEGWMVAMKSCFEQGRECIGGPISYERLNSSSTVASRGARQAGIETALGFLPFAHSSNLGVTRAVFDSVGGFAEEVRPAGEDIDFSWRVQLAGVALHEEPTAIVHYRLRGSLPDVWRQSVAYGTSEALLFRRFRHEGLRRRTVSAPVKDLWWILTRAPFAVRRDRRGAWIRKSGQFVGRMLGCVQHRVVWW